MSGRLMKYVMFLGLCALAMMPVAAAAQKRIHGFIEPMPAAKLKQLFPRAVTFTPRGVDPPHFTAYSVEQPTAQTKPIGFAFWTIEIAPEMLGYHGHIHMLIGMDTRGTLTGVIVDLNTEPYGHFSVDRPEFAAQFKGKSIRDPFIVGKDVDAMSTATITLRAAALTIRETSRTVAKAVLTPDALRR
jgi:transcriptional regulator of nitric oxide reductase